MRGSDTHIIIYVVGDIPFAAAMRPCFATRGRDKVHETLGIALLPHGFLPVLEAVDSAASQLK